MLPDASFIGTSNIKSRYLDFHVLKINIGISKKLELCERKENTTQLGILYPWKAPIGLLYNL